MLGSATRPVKLSKDLRSETYLFVTHYVHDLAHFGIDQLGYERTSLVNWNEKSSLAPATCDLESSCFQGLNRSQSVFWFSTSVALFS